MYSRQWRTESRKRATSLVRDQTGSSMYQDRHNRLDVACGIFKLDGRTCFETRQFLQMDRALKKTRVLVGRVQSSPFFLLVESFSRLPSAVLFIYSTSFLRLPRITISKIATLEPLRRRTIDKRSVSNLFGIHLPSPGPTFISPL